MGFIAKIICNGVEMLSFFVLHNETLGDKPEDNFVECVGSSNGLSSFAL
jgi:hypothetical protein